jgi:organic hydroperoxide reductase OsmC/OhrA
MIISATIKNGFQQNDIVVATDNNPRSVSIPAKPAGGGSSVNGGELLFLALATCFCNDIYREAARRKMHLDSVEVTVSGEFGKEGEPASNIRYETEIKAPNNSPQEIADLIHHVDGIAEIHNTLRKGVEVILNPPGN